MGRSSERRSSKASHHPNITMFRFVALFALVAVAFAEPEADPQLFYNHWGVPAVPVVKPVVPVVQYVDPHHTEGMTKEGVPEKTDSVKIAEKAHEYAKVVEEAKKKMVYPVYSHGVYNPVYYNHGVAPHVYGTYPTTTYTGYPYTYTYPYTHSYYPYVSTVAAKHVIAKREAEGDSQFYYNTY